MNQEETEQHFERGYKAAMNRILRECIRDSGIEGDAEKWRIERAETVAALRMICDDFGDNDWPDDLHLADVIDKHLGRYLHDAAESVGQDSGAGQ